MKEVMLSEGDRVRLTYDHEQTGTVTRWGPFVCEVKFDDKAFKYIVNRFLEKLPKKKVANS